MVMDFEEDYDSYGDSTEDEDDEDYDPEGEEEEEEEEGGEAENQDEEDSEEDDDGGGDEEEESEENEGEFALHAEVDDEDSEEDDDDGGDEEEGEENEGEFAPHAEMDEEGRPASSDSEEEGGLHLASWISGVGGLAPSAAVVVRDDRRDLVAVETPAGEGKECEESSGSVNQSIASCCPICYEPWTSGGDHRVCCIPCGHIYGRSCLEKWLQQCQREARECPQCKEKFEPQQIVNLYAPPVVLQNDDLEKLIPRAKELVAMEERLQRKNEVVKETHRETEEKFQSMHVETKETHQETHDMIRTPAGEL